MYQHLGSSPQRAKKEVNWINKRMVIVRYLRGSGQKTCLLLPLMNFPYVLKSSDESEMVHTANNSVELLTFGKFLQPVRK